MDSPTEMQFLDSYENEVEQERINFMYSFFYDYLKLFGPQTVAEIEKFWEEHKNFFENLSEYVPFGLSNFLLKSEKFTYHNDKVIITSDLPEESNNPFDKIYYYSESDSDTCYDGNINNNDFNYENVDKIITAEEIIEYNNDKKSSLCDRLNNLSISDIKTDEIIPKSINLKINSVLVIGMHAPTNEIVFTIRPAHEYIAPVLIQKPMRLSGAYSFKCAVDFTDNNLNILSGLLKMHLLLLDVQDFETLNFKIHGAQIKNNQPVLEHNSTSCSLETVQNTVGTACGNSGVLDLSQPNSTLLESIEISLNRMCDMKIQQERLLIEQYQYVDKLQFFFKNCEDLKKILSGKKRILQEAFLQMIMEMENDRVTFKQQSLRYLIFIKNMTEKQIFRFQDKCSVVLQQFHNIKLLIMTSQNIEHLVKFLTQAMENFHKIEIVFHDFVKNILSEEVFDLTTFMFISDEPDSLHQVIKNIVVENMFVKKQLDLKQSYIQILQKYIYGPVCGIVNIERFWKSVQSPIDVNLLRVNFESGASLSLPLRESNDNNGDQLSEFQNLSQGCKPKQVTSTNDQVFEYFKMEQYDNVLSSAIIYKKLSVLNFGNLTKQIAKYIVRYNNKGLIFMTKKQSTVTDSAIIAITIYFGISNPKNHFEPFITIELDFNINNGPHNINMVVKKFSHYKILKLDSKTGEDAKKYSDSKEQSGRSLKSSLNDPLSETPSRHMVIICSICQEGFRKKQKYHLECSHIFHKECIDVWAKKSSLCPVCHAEIVVDEFPPLI